MWGVGCGHHLPQNLGTAWGQTKGQTGRAGSPRSRPQVSLPGAGPRGREVAAGGQSQQQCAASALCPRGFTQAAIALGSHPRGRQRSDLWVGWGGVGRVGVPLGSARVCALVEPPVLPSCRPWFPSGACGPWGSWARAPGLTVASVPGSALSQHEVWLLPVSGVPLSVGLGVSSVGVSVAVGLGPW